MDEKEIMVSLGDKRVKEIGEIIGNKTCNKILDLLTEGEMTVSEISTKMKIPLNTADYNIKKLAKAGLIEKASHWWSVKGKRMNSYKVSNKRIIISPKKSVGNIFVWVLGLTGLTGLTIKQFMKEANPIYETSGLIAKKEAGFAPIRATNDVVADQAVSLVGNMGFFQNLSPWTWFILGAWFAILLFFMFTIWTERGRKK